MKGRFVLWSFVLVFAVLAWGAAAVADAVPQEELIRNHFLKANASLQELALGQGDLRAHALGQAQGPMEGTSAGATGLKSPGKALLLSAAVPGAGEFYAGAWKRGIAFSALEVASWTWYFTQHSAGKDKEDEYEDFADDEWSREQYQDWYDHWEDWYDARKGDNDPPFESIFTHELPGQKDEDYYEMIGKYDQFSYGWIGNPDDYLPGEFAPNDSLLGYDFTDQYTTRDICRGVDATATAHRNSYVNQRGDANDLLKRATWGISASLFNHVISALDAVVAAKAYNRRVLQEAGYPQLRMELDMYAGEVIPKFTLTKRF
ncbi:MAG: hypothetical protein AMJ92_01845 [candidate division Zixibacteria bacterium SM23_81]|nr:MAG: hypothetical protein AMJ92_01845 [candidate division Zixibacteria bacterium SM23_81]